MTKPRPKHLELMRIHLPVPGWVSILHRISGAALFLMLPLLLYLFGASVGSETTFAAYKATVGNPLVKIILLGLLWGFLHHVCAGIRYLALDLHIGTTLEAARASSIVVLAASLTATAAIGAMLW
jgi:succinate dehydrogenase / fumarate reductase cytochrome b subunit